MMEKAKQEQEKRNQLRRLEEERREKEQKYEQKDRLDREKCEGGPKEEEEKGHQERKKLERQKAKEEEDRDSKLWEGKEKRGKEPSADAPSKSMSLDSPAPHHVVSEIKVNLSLKCVWKTRVTAETSQCKRSCSSNQMFTFTSPHAFCGSLKCASHPKHCCSINSEFSESSVLPIKSQSNNYLINSCSKCTEL